jgi:hypothetical protein
VVLMIVWGTLSKFRSTPYVENRIALMKNWLGELSDAFGAPRIVATHPSPQISFRSGNYLIKLTDKTQPNRPHEHSKSNFQAHRSGLQK